MEIAEDAEELAANNGVYASVLVAQACLESGFGTSGLAAGPDNNLFGIKGLYKGKGRKYSTLEDDGTGNLYPIYAVFRSYPSYRESIEDYIDLLLNYKDGFYHGVLKSNTNSYEDATRFLTGRYATDTYYNVKLNQIISDFNLTALDKTPGELYYTKIEPSELPDIITSEISSDSISPCHSEIDTFEDIMVDDLKSIKDEDWEPVEIDTEENYE